MTLLPPWGLVYSKGCAAVVWEPPCPAYTLWWLGLFSYKKDWYIVAWSLRIGFGAAKRIGK